MDGDFAKVLLNLSYLEEKGEIARLVYFVGQNKLNEAFIVIGNMFEKHKEKVAFHSLIEFTIGTGIDVLASALSDLILRDNVGYRTVSFSDSISFFLETIKSFYTKNYYIFDRTPFERFRNCNVVLTDQKQKSNNDGYLDTGKISIINII
jgi:hypothetical protein